MSANHLVAGCFRIRNMYILSNLLFIALTCNVILAHFHNDIRCSHRPNTPEIHHVWLDDANPNGSDVSPENNTGFTIVEEAQPRSSKIRRQVDSRNDVPDSQSGIQDSIWRLLKGFGKASHANKGLVPMKIQVFYDKSVYSLDKAKRDLINGTVMPTVVRFFESVLSVRGDYTIDKFRISRRCPNNTIYYARDSLGTSRPYCMERCENYAFCGEMLVPPAHLSACSYCNSTSKRCTTNYSSEGKGVSNTQLLLYVSAKQTARCRHDQTIAYAAHCAQDAITDRPVAGHANLCPSSISTEPKDLKALIATVKHELTHVLGFSVSLFAYYRDEFGQPLTERDSLPGPIPVDPTTGYARWSEKVIKKYIRTDWVTGEGKVEKEVHLVVTPTVVREVRRHFNCSTLEGAELEDQGSDGTSMTHWEKRLFENEAMTGTHTQNSVYSRLTLAVLQDTGWYVANFSRAERLDWGKDLGCDFTRKSCKSWIDERRERGHSIKPFCDNVKSDLLHISCTEDRTSKAVCNMKQFKDPLPAIYKHFDHLDGVPEDNLTYYGGSVDLADYCPFIQEFTWQAHNVTVRGSRCDLGVNNLEAEKNAALEYYGPETICLEHGHKWEQRSCIFKRNWHHYGAGCYRYSCSDGHVEVHVGNHTYHCYYADQLIRVEQVIDNWLYNGSIICPSCSKICAAHECKHYDKSLVDRILEFLQRPKVISEEFKPNRTKIEVLFDSFSNSIDTGSELVPDSSSFGELVDTKSNISSGLGLPIHEELDRFRDHLLRISGHRKPSRAHLMCSSVIGIHAWLSPIAIFTTTLSMTVIMTQTRRMLRPYE